MKLGTTMTLGATPTPASNDSGPCNKGVGVAHVWAAPPGLLFCKVSVSFSLRACVDCSDLAHQKL